MDIVCKRAVLMDEVPRGLDLRRLKASADVPHREDIAISETRHLAPIPSVIEAWEGWAVRTQELLVLYSVQKTKTKA